MRGILRVTIGDKERLLVEHLNQRKKPRARFSCAETLEIPPLTHSLVLSCYLSHSPSLFIFLTLLFPAVSLHLSISLFILIFFYLPLPLSKPFSISLFLSLFLSFHIYYSSFSICILFSIYQPLFLPFSISLFFLLVFSPSFIPSLSPSPQFPYSTFSTFLSSVLSFSTQSKQRRFLKWPIEKLSFRPSSQRFLVVVPRSVGKNPVARERDD